MKLDIKEFAQYVTKIYDKKYYGCWTNSYINENNKRVLNNIDMLSYFFGNCFIYNTWTHFIKKQKYLD